MSLLMLEGEVDNRDGLISSLQDEVRQLKKELAAARIEVSRARQEGARAVGMLRQQLSPLYRALQAVFGEIEAVGGEESFNDSGSKAAKWGPVKQRLAPRLREAVDILLLQGTMRRTQLANALKMDYSNCTKNVIQVLIRQGWVVDNGGALSLKEL